MSLLSLNQYEYINNKDGFFIPWEYATEADIETLMHRYMRLSNNSSGVFKYPFTHTLGGLIPK